MASFLQILRRLLFLTLVIASTCGVLLVWKHESIQYMFKMAKEVVPSVPVTGILTSPTAEKPMDIASLFPCPETPPNIGEPLKLNLTSITRAELQTKYPSHSGDRYRPDGCRPGQRLAVVIPFRDREQHLWILLNNLIPFLKKQQADFTIFVAEQAPGGIFNRGLMINAGVVAALKADNFTCIVIHDVDLIPETGDNYYRCRDDPVHLSTAISKFGYKLPYSNYTGGNLAISPCQFKRMNGFSNLYFGWGGEDDDFHARVVTNGITLRRNPTKQGKYYAIKHKRDKMNPINPDRYLLLKSRHRRMKTEGLTSLHCNTTVSHHGIVTWLTVAIDKQYYNSVIKY